jgi:hypothetical protein
MQRGSEAQPAHGSEERELHELGVMNLLPIATVAILSMSCGPMDTPPPPEGDDFVVAVRDGLAFVLELGTPDTHLPELENSPGAPAVAHALRWDGERWVRFESRPTRAEACGALGVCALEAAAELCSDRWATDRDEDEL